MALKKNKCRSLSFNTWKYKCITMSNAFDTLWSVFALRSGGAQMRSSAAYPLSFGRFVAKEHLDAMDT